MVFRSDSPEQTQEIAVTLAGLLDVGDVVALCGDLGAGKTRFVQGLARGLGVSGYVRSPSFTLINEYRGRVNLYHMDVYRLNDGSEADDIGLDDYFDSDGVTAIEWADRIADMLPRAYLEVRMARDTEFESVRDIEIRGYGQRYERMCEEMKKLCRC